MTGPQHHLDQHASPRPKEMTMTPTAIGLDLSLTGSGVASSNGWCERVGTRDVTTMSLGERIIAVDSLVSQILILTGQPALVCVEVPAFSRAGGGALERAALWWLVVRTLRAREIPVAEIYNQHRMRYATGKPKADKGAIIDAVARRWPQFETGGDDNLADATVLACMGADHLGVPLAAMPQAHRKALDGVRWPDGLGGPPDGESGAPVPPPSADAWDAAGRH